METSVRFVIFLAYECHYCSQQMDGIVAPHVVMVISGAPGGFMQSARHFGLGGEIQGA